MYYLCNVNVNKKRPGHILLTFEIIQSESELSILFYTMLILCDRARLMSESIAVHSVFYGPRYLASSF